MRPLLAAAALAALPALLPAQGHAGHQAAAPAPAAPATAAQQRHDPASTEVRRFPRPAGWQVRPDRPDAPDSALAFADMPPGWHVTTGPSAILYDTTRTARGDFLAQAELFLFPGERAEGFGLFVGGGDLQGDAQRYTYVLLRKDGSFTVKRRDGARAAELVPWTRHRAIPVHDKAEGTVKYQLGVDAAGDSVHFLVNGMRVTSLPRAVVSPDGVVGLRVNHALNLHVTSLDVRPR